MRAHTVFRTASVACAVALLTAILAATAPVASAQSCAFTPAESWQGAQLNRNADADAGAYFYVSSRVSIDADGAPNAYHPDNIGLDHVGNAGWPDKSWWRNVLVVDPADPSKAYIQTEGRFAGYFIAKSTLTDTTSPETNPAKYVDAATIPYIAFPGGFAAMPGTGRMGDLGFAIHLESGRSSPFIVADVAPRNDPLGEMSMALAAALSGQKTVNPRNGAGAPRGDIAYVVFRFSSDDSRAKRWPLTAEVIATRVDALMDGIGGAGAIRACLP